MKKKVEFSTPEAERDYKKFKKAMDKKYMKKLVLCPYCNKPFDWDGAKQNSKCSHCGNDIQFHGRSY